MLERPTLRLPAGMRDFAPAAAAARRRIAEALMRVFERWGYERVITPAFEYEDVLALGLGAAGREAAIRFVEPSSGQVVALRPDITPQVARLIATRFRDEPGPLRLCYEGTVVRLDRGARSQRELIQAGIELAGVPTPGGDAEVIALGAAALAAVGLARPTIDLGHPGLARAVLEALDLPPAGLALVRRCIAKRDAAGLDAALGAARGPRRVIDFAACLPELSGPPSILAAALRKAPTAAIRGAIESLRAVVCALEEGNPGGPGDVGGRGGRRIDRHINRHINLGARLHVDLGEVRGFDYYTGVRLQGFVDGAPEPLLQGGRYDTLLSRYGRQWPAVGFAIDVEATAAALELGGSAAAGPHVGDGAGGVLVSGPSRQAWRMAAALRRRGRRAAVDHGVLASSDLPAYASRWRFAEVVRAKRSNANKANRAKKTAGD